MGIFHTGFVKALLKCRVGGNCTTFGFGTEKKKNLNRDVRCQLNVIVGSSFKCYRKMQQLFI